MKALVVFYSLEGNTKLIANSIAQQLNAELLELKPEKEIPRQGAQKYLWGGKSVIFKEKPKLLNEKPSLDQYDTIFIGTPIWAGSYAPPIHTFIADNALTDKKLVFFACHAGSGAKKCFEKLKKELKSNTTIGTIEFVDPIKQDKEKVKEQVKDWIQSMI